MLPLNQDRFACVSVRQRTTNALRFSIYCNFILSMAKQVIVHLCVQKKQQQ